MAVRGDKLETRPLRVVLLWRGEAMQERLFTEPVPITVGTSKLDTFTVPPSALGDQFPIFSPSADNTGFVLTLADGMCGRLNLSGAVTEVSDFLRQGRGVAIGHHRQQPLSTSDWGIVGLDARGEVAVFFEFLAKTTWVGPAPFGDRFLGNGLALSAVVHVALVAIAFVVWEAEDHLDVDPPPSTAIAKLILEPEEKPPEEPVAKKKAKQEDTSKKAAQKEGKIGNPDAKTDKTVIPKGPRDQIVAKVSNTGLLGMLKQPKQSQALKTLLSDTPDATMTTAMAGLKGAELAIGKGAGGLSTRGEGPGGGGKGGGQILGVGDLAVGGGGNGKHATGLGGGRVAKEKGLSLSTAGVETGSGLSKEQILKVVQSHAAAIQFCYEKELQRFPNLAGKVVVGWKVNLLGRVEDAKVDSSSLGNPSAESCMVRQVRNWQFPKPNGVVCNVHFPFFFKGR
jgi:outer membrane biosynthesis protein TonB